ncbi:hypothetical protein EPYR_03931 [Erwinia pyrifoliae DSM 12163]|nr:hypothetical protein EPYR_03931 [Erwinia pyrifoliae DSM 12163]
MKRGSYHQEYALLAEIIVPASAGFCFFAGISPVHRANAFDSSVAHGQYSCADSALLNNFCGIDVEGSQ